MLVRNYGQKFWFQLGDNFVGGSQNFEGKFKTAQPQYKKYF